MTRRSLIEMFTERGGRVRPVGGYTLVELLTTISVLVIALGLMVSLARRVRAQSADSVTKGLLSRLETLLVEYARRSGQDFPIVPELIPEAPGLYQPPDERILLRNAERNNREMVRAMKTQMDLFAAFSDLPISYYDETTLRDAWGMPIAFMPAFHPAVGMAPGNRPFFFSAGPDGRFLTRADNLYSYETAGAKQ